MSKSYKVYTINCALCNTYILTYHKYGAGKGIIRLYFKNIVAPKNLTKNFGSDNEKHLRCTNCGNVMGVKDVQKGKLVYRMRKGYFHRKLE